MIIQKLDPDLPSPSRAHNDDAGIDLYSAEGPVLFWPGDRFLISTGIRVRLPVDTVGMVCPRSGLANAKGVTVLNAPGIVDQGYTGEIFVNLVNLSNSTYELKYGDRIAQLVVVPIILPSLHVYPPNSDTFNVDHLFETDRGAKGHGSTGR